MMSRRSTSSLDGGDRMTATEELRAELTRRGIEWRWEDERTTYWYVTVDGEEWGEWTAIEMGGYLHLSFSSGDVLTPAQAIAATVGSDKVEAVLRKLVAQLGVAADFHFARKYVDCIVEEYAGKLATLGRGACKEVKIDRHFRGCSECGYRWEHMYAVGWQVGPKFCPNCGKRVDA